MSLAPGEQRALVGIEDTLRRSDPRLAARLATFRPALRARMLIRLTRTFRRRTGQGRR
ncbi:MAG TPA: DUF3040 domain-containing protein [Streptosporangiaceae bacterium]|nr:DUF3040 domain-containing protein [Streptosporangiaceae bacterium]